MIQPPITIRISTDTTTPNDAEINPVMSEPPIPLLIIIPFFNKILQKVQRLPM